MNDKTKTTPKEVPSRLWYLLIPVALVAYFAAVFLVGVPLFDKVLDGLDRVEAPGVSDINLKAPGSYIIFHERRNPPAENQAEAADITSRFTFRLSHVKSGNDVALDAVGTNTTYDIRERAGASIFTFEITTPGRYRIEAEQSDGGTKSRTLLAIGRDFRVWWLLGTLAIVFLGLAIPAALATLIYRRRKPFDRGIGPIAFFLSFAVLVVRPLVNSFLFGRPPDMPPGSPYFMSAMGAIVFGLGYFLLWKKRARFPEPVILMVLSVPYISYLPMLMFLLM